MSLPTFTWTSKYVETTVHRPRLSTLIVAFIRVFLHAYNQYATKIKERSWRLVAQDVIATKAITPVSFKFCMDAEWLESLIVLGFVSYESW